MHASLRPYLGKTAIGNEARRLTVKISSEDALRRQQAEDGVKLMNKVLAARKGNTT